MSKYSPPLDKGIERAVKILRKAGVETYESCEGGKRHAYKEPTVRFHGDAYAGYYALFVAMQNKLPVKSLNRSWDVIENEIDGPTWEMTFWRDKAE